jgi:hypothetical protein
MISRKYNTVLASIHVHLDLDLTLNVIVHHTQHPCLRNATGDRLGTYL